MRILATIAIGLPLIMFLACGGNDLPVIKEVLVNQTEVEAGGELAINVIADDPDGDPLTY